MSRCRTRRSTSPMETSPSTSAHRSSPATTSRRRSPLPSVAIVDVEEGRRGGLRRDHRSGRARQGPKGPLRRRPPRRVGHHVVQPRRDVPRLPRPDGQVRPPHRTEPRLHDGRRRRQAGRLAGLPRHRRTSATGRTPAEVDPRGRRDARRAVPADPAAALRHGGDVRPAASRGRPRHLTFVAPPTVGEVRHDGRSGRDRRSTSPGCASRTASRSSSTASISTSPRARSSPSSDRTAPARRPWSRSCRR